MLNAVKNIVSSEINTMVKAIENDGFTHKLCDGALDIIDGKIDLVNLYVEKIMQNENYTYEELLEVQKERAKLYLLIHVYKNAKDLMCH